MSSSPTKNKTPPAVTGSDSAPVIYSDGAVASSMINGVVQIELAANCLIPTELDSNKPPRLRTMITAHLRCSAAAAMQIRDAIDKALKIAGAKPKAKPVVAKAVVEKPADVPAESQEAA